MTVRRIVVGHDTAGASVIASDADMPGIAMPGVGLFTAIWSADGPARYPDRGHDPAAAGIYPPVGGVRLVISRYAPGQKLGAADGAPADIPWEEDGMHRTDTTDFVLLMEGELVLTVDRGVERTIRPGEVVVMAGARHAWRNDGDREAVVAFFMIGAESAAPAER